ncbi:MAG TPA: alkaline phosphatase [Deltaproteobacteria bacterium]|nr:alkaline phosphatase [Deltaproteobacteria bacterium]
MRLDRPRLGSARLAARLSLALLLTLTARPSNAERPSEPSPTTRPAPTTQDARERNAWFTAGRAEVRRSARFVAGEAPARNVILFVGDGMGISTVTAARILEGQRQGHPGEENRLAFEDLPHVAFSKTYNTDAQVADSASTMTAIMTGVKTKTGVLGVDARVRRGDDSSVAGARVPTLLEEAEDRGLATGIVTTATLTHATPAGCYAHVPIRFWEDDSKLSASAREAGFPDIARQLIEFAHGDGIEVALGGGRIHFLPEGIRDPESLGSEGHRKDGRDLTKEWQDGRPGSAHVWNRRQLRAIDPKKTRHVLGLFEPGHMKFEVDRNEDPAGEPSLAEMTAFAIDFLARSSADGPRGYFLMVEAGRIDHAHHAGNAYRALTETIALSDAVRVALEKTDPDETLVVVTADHSHTLTISGYPTRGNPILGKVVGFDWLSDDDAGLSLAADGKPYTTLSYANGSGDPERPDLTDVDTEAPSFKQEVTVPMQAETHAGEDVPIYAGGPRAALFHGVREQNFIYHALVEALGWTRNGNPVDDPEREVPVNR